MEQVGFGTSFENKCQHRRIWKHVSDMGRAGVYKVLVFVLGEPRDTYGARPTVYTGHWVLGPDYSRDS